VSTEASALGWTVLEVSALGWRRSHWVGGVHVGLEAFTLGWRCSRWVGGICIRLEVSVSCDSPAQSSLIPDLMLDWLNESKVEISRLTLSHSHRRYHPARLPAIPSLCPTSLAEAHSHVCG
jgi:hypothetical protein